MVQTLLSIVFFVTFSQNVLAADKAFSVLLDYGFRETDLVKAVEKYPELKEINFVSDDELHPNHSQVKLYSNNSNEAYIISKSGDGFEVEKTEVQFENEIKTIEGDIKNTLFETVLKETQSENLAAQMAEAFKDDFSTTKGLRAQASFHFQVEQYFDEGEFVKYGNIVKASLIIGKAITAKSLKLDPDTFSWNLLPEDAGLVDKPFYAPVKSSRVSSLFQLNRRHPVTRRHQPHNGIDFVASKGTAVFPALDGEVVTISRTRSKGKYITILHDNGYLSTYIHLSKFQKGLRVGMRVELDDQIGEVGRTGYATGAHLHFGVIKDGLFVNPIFLLKSYCYSDKDEHETLDAIDEMEEPEVLDSSVTNN